LSIPSVYLIYVTVTGGTTSARRTVYDGSISSGKISTGTYSFFGTEKGAGFTPSSTIAAANVTFTSLLNETTKASATATSDVHGQMTSINVTDAGTEYPANWNNNYASASNPSFTSFISVQWGNIKVLNFNYGTGTARAVDVE